MCGAFAVGASVRGSLCRTYNRVVYVWGLLTSAQGGFGSGCPEGAFAQ